MRARERENERDVRARERERDVRERENERERETCARDIFLWGRSSRYNRDFIIAQSSTATGVVNESLWTVYNANLPLIESNGDRLSQDGVETLVESLSLYLRLGQSRMRRHAGKK